MNTLTEPCALRRKAERKCKQKKTVIKGMSEVEIQRLVYELEVHQIELEMQNDELRRVQEGLEKSCAEYTSLYDFAPVGYVTLDERGVILNANLTACAEIGADRSRLRRKPFAVLVQKNDAETFRFHLQRVFETSERQICEVSIKRKNGPLLHAQLQSIASKADGKEPRTCRITITDITERKQAEEKMTFRNVLLFTQMETSLDGILLVDESGKALFFNQRFGDMWGIPAEVLESRSDERMLQLVLEKLVAPEKFLNRIRYLYKHHNEKSHDEIPLVDGRIFDRYSTGMFGEEGKYYGRVWYFRDITQRKQAEEALRKSEATIQSLFKIAPVGICIMKDRVYKSANNYWCEMFGYREEDLLGKTTRMLYESDEEWERVGRELYVHFPEKGPASVETRLCRSDGSFRDVILNTAPIHPDDLAAGTVVTIHDITERKENERALLESEQKYRELVEHANSIILRWDSEGRISFLNEFGQRFFGYSAEEVIGRHVVGTITPQAESSGRDLQRLMDQICADPKAFEQNVNENMRRNGERVWVAWTNKIKQGAQGQVTEILSIGTDITASKLVQDELRRNEQQFRLIMDNLADLVAVLDLDGRRLYNSPSYDRILGDPDKLIGLSSFEEIHPEDRNRVQQTFQGTVRTGVGHRLEYRLLDRNGKPHHIESQGSVIRDGQGRVAQILVVSRDITERIKAEERLRTSEAYLREGERIARIGGWCTDLDMKTITVTSGFLALLGLPSDYALSFNEAFKFVLPAYRKATKKALARCRETEMPQTAQVEILTASGQNMWVEYRIMADRSTGAGRPLMGVMQDITERKHAMELEVEMLAAEAANKAKSFFLATMSHEIRTPMNAVIGAVDVLRQTRLLDDQVELVEIMYDSAQGLLSIINDILDFSKIEAGKMELEYHPISLGDLVESVCMALCPEALDKCVHLSCFVDPRLPDFLSDSVRVRQILTNLIGNAIKFSTGQPRPARVKVRAEWDGVKLVRLTVADNGVGMTPEVVAKLFTPFTQADDSITRRFGGTGLGLSICKNLVTMLNGSLDVESTLGEGSIFTVTLPVEVFEGPSGLSTLPSLSGLDCVLVSDAPEIIDDWRAYLEVAGARIAVAGTLKQTAVQLACEKITPVPVVVINCLHGASDFKPIQDPLAAFPGDMRYVLVKTGSHHHIRQEQEGVFVLYGDVMRRETFLHAVALAAGRAKPAEEDSWEALSQQILPPSREEAIAQGRLILVAEDNDINQKVIRHQLAMLGFACEITGNGEEALTLWRTGKYGLLISDLQMPIMDGYSLAAAIRKEESEGIHIPIIAFTASVSRGEREQCTAAGMDEYLVKPAPMDMFRNMLNKWLPPVENHDTSSDAASKTPKTTSGAGAKTINSTNVLNMSVLVKLVGDDPMLIAEFLADYLNSVGKAAGEIRAAFTEGDWKTVGTLGHRLKSSSRSVGAMLLGDCCERLEHAAKADNGDAVSALMPEFEQNVADVINAIIDQKRS